MRLWRCCWYSVGFLFILPVLLIAQEQESNRQRVEEDSTARQSVVILPSQITVPDTLEPLMPTWLGWIFGSHTRSPFITVVLEPGVCSRCEAYLPHLFDVTLRVDSALRDNIALIFHSISPGAVDVLRKRYPYKDYPVIRYDSAGIAEAIVPSGMPYYVVWDATGKPLYSALLFGQVDLERLMATLRQALQHRQPLEIAADARFLSKVGSSVQCTFTFQTTGSYRWTPENEYVLSNVFFSPGQSSIMGIFPQFGFLAVESDILQAYILHSLVYDSLLCIFQLPAEVVLRHVSVDSSDIANLRRLGLLRPILTGGLQISPDAVVRELYLPKIFYQLKENGDTAIGASTIKNIALFTGGPEQCLRMDTLFSVSHIEGYTWVLSDVYTTNPHSLARAKLLLRLTRGVPFTSYAYLEGNILRRHFYDSAFAFAVYDVNAQRLTILPIRLPEVYRRLRVGYGPLIPHSGCFVDSNRYAAVYPLSPYLWIYGPHSVDTIALRSYATIKQQIEQIAPVLHSLYEAIRDTNAFFENYSKVVDTVKSFLKFVPVNIKRVDDSLVAVSYRMRLLRDTASRSEKAKFLIIRELYNIRTKEFVTLFSISDSNPEDQCGILTFYHIPRVSWNTHWYLVRWEGNRMRVTRFRMLKQ